MNTDPELTPTACAAKAFEAYAADQRPLSDRLIALAKKLEQQTGFEGANYRRFLAIEIDDYTENEIRLRAQTPAADLDSRRLDWLEANKHAVWHSQLHASWAVQKTDQVVGNIGTGRTIRAAIDAAMQRAAMRDERKGGGA